MSDLVCDQQEPDTARRRIIFVESAAAMGGVQFSTLYLAQNLDRSKWKPIVLCPEEGDLTRACRDSGIEVRVLPQPRLWSTSVRMGAVRLPNPAAWAWDVGLIAMAASRLRRFLVHCSPDVVVTKGLSSHLLGGLATRKLRTPCVWHVQDFISERSFGIYKRAFGLVARWLPEQIIVDGASIAEQLPRPLQSRVTVIHNGVDTNIFRPRLDRNTVRRELGLPIDQLVVGHVGRLTPWKGQHYLIEAFARISGEHPTTTLLLVGSPVFDNDKYELRLRTMVAQLGLADRVKFAGYRHDLAGVLSAMDIFAFTSIEKDTSPLALLSAMSCGLPIVAFDIAGVKELMTSEQCSLVPAGQVRALVDSLKALITDEALRQRLALKAREAVMNGLSLERYTSGMEQVFLKVSSNRQGENMGYVAAGLPKIQRETFES
jgi:glycosyltransferase involved in cell wall biosynthesis